jgi:DNA-binding transcriptional LysR family regulator
LEELDGRPIILYNQDSVQNQILQARFSALDIHPRIIMRSSQIPTILRFLREGRCGSFFYKDMISLFPEIIGIPLSPEIMTRAGIIWRRGRYISNSMQIFLDFCRDYYK